jgi:hypothetical protein
MVTQNSTAVNTQNCGLDALTWLADQGATFCLPRGRTKGNDANGRPTLPKGWQNTPHTLEQAIIHTKSGGNAGLLTGKHSGQIVALDCDINFPELVVMLGVMGRTVKIVRSNAPERGKFLYRIKGELPQSTTWKKNSADEHPSAEFLSTGRQAIVPPSEFEKGCYQLIDQEYGILAITPEQMNKIWWLITGESLDKKQRKPTARQTENTDYVDRVRDAWPTINVFEHFDKHRNGVIEGRTETRLLGNGGLLINEWRWFCHSAGVGGDQFDAWAYCKWQRIINRDAPADFWDVVNEMADAARIDRPRGKPTKQAKPESIDNDGQPTEDAPAQDSAITLAQLEEELKSRDTSDITSLKRWLIDQVGLMATLTPADLTRWATTLRGYGVPAVFFKEELLPLIAELRDDQGAEFAKQADKLITLARENARFFTGRSDSLQYASVRVDGHTEVYRMRSERFNEWLSELYYVTFGTTVSAQAREDAKKILAFEARRAIEDVFIRVGHHMGKVYIDMGSADHSAIEVDESGWRIVATPPVNFRRSDHMLPLVLPIKHPDLLILRKHLNIDDAAWPLVAGWGVAAIHPNGPYPDLALLSLAGSGKSTMLRMFKRLIDPSSAELRSLSTDVRDLFIAAANSWLLAFDNVSSISPEMSDALCILASGGGFTKRANYTDGDEHVINVQRPVAINGIGDIITRQDLMDRSIPIATPYIPEEERQPEAEFWAAFEEDKPKILGALLYGLSTALRNVGNVKLDKTPRMADFAKIAVAAESAYTDGKNSFLEMYTTNREDAAATIVENSPVGDVLRRLVNLNGRMQLTPTELFDRLNKEARDYESNARTWPSAPNKLKSIVERLAPALMKQGVSISHAKNNGTRGYTLDRISQ